MPGIGPKGAQAIMTARRQGRLRHLGELRALGIVTERAAPFILLDGIQPVRQLTLF